MAEQIIQLFQEKVKEIEAIQSAIIEVYSSHENDVVSQCMQQDTINLMFSYYLHATIVPPEIIKYLNTIASIVATLEQAKMELRDKTYAVAIDCMGQLHDKTRVNLLIFDYPKNNYVHKIHTLIGETTNKTLDLYKLADKEANFMKGFIADKLIIETKIRIMNTIMGILEGIKNDAYHIEITMKLINNELNEIRPNKGNSNRMYS